MNRTIEFRGFNRKNGVWIYGYYLMNRGAHFVCPDEWANGKTWEDYEVDPTAVGQFTGLFDKNKNKIYEGDFIKTQWSGNDFFIVTWHTDGYFFLDPTGGQWELFGNGFRPLGEMLRVKINGEVIQTEVIGNIHDNPELITNTNK